MTASKLELVKKVLLEIAEDNPEILKKPEPSVWFVSFGSSSFNLELIAWVSSPIRRHFIISDLNFEIAKRFDEYGIELTYPWTNIAFRSDLKIRDGINGRNAGDNDGDKII